MMNFNLTQIPERTKQPSQRIQHEQQLFMQHAVYQRQSPINAK